VDLVEERESECGDARFGAARDHDVGVAVPVKEW
jgi:hypothetical protein